MKIIVCSHDSENRIIRLPSIVALNPITAVFLPSLLKQHGVSINRKQALILVKAVNQYRRAHPAWKLIEIQSANGKWVEIKI